MIHIKHIKIVKNSGYHVLKPGFEFDCMDVNIIVGDQGSGKSTMLKKISMEHPDFKFVNSDEVNKFGIDTRYFDSEKDNPRMVDPRRYTTTGGESVGYGYGNALLSRCKSHGEVIAPIVTNALRNFKNQIVFLDEPESGLSITNQFKLIESVKIAVDNGCQLFIATHCYPLINNFDVISLDHFKVMKGSTFIKKIKNNI